MKESKKSSSSCLTDWSWSATLVKKKVLDNLKPDLVKTYLGKYLVLFDLVSLHSFPPASSQNVLIQQNPMSGRDTFPESLKSICWDTCKPVQLKHLKSERLRGLWVDYQQPPASSHPPRGAHALLQRVTWPGDYNAPQCELITSWLPCRLQCCCQSLLQRSGGLDCSFLTVILYEGHISITTWGWDVRSWNKLS